VRLNLWDEGLKKPAKFALYNDKLCINKGVQ
jgi:hypothetical protein